MNHRDVLELASSIEGREIERWQISLQNDEEIPGSSYLRAIIALVRKQLDYGPFWLPFRFTGERNYCRAAGLSADGGG